MTILGFAQQAATYAIDHPGYMLVAIVAVVVQTIGVRAIIRHWTIAAGLVIDRVRPADRLAFVATFVATVTVGAGVLLAATLCLAGAVVAVLLHLAAPTTPRSDAVLIGLLAYGIGTLAGAIGRSPRAT